MKTVKRLLTITLLSSFASFSSVAMADDHCLDGNTTTCITEEEIVMFGDPAIEYTIDNNSGERLYAFGVSNDIMYGQTSTFNAGWNSEFFNEKAWNAGMGMFTFWEAPEVFEGSQVLDEFTKPRPVSPTKVWISGTGLSNPYPYGGLELQSVQKLDCLDDCLLVPQPVEVVYLGSFASLFGTEDDGVAFYWNSGLGQNPLNDGVELDNFFLASQPYSDFSTFGAQGNVVTTSVAAIPEPETYAMFLAGLGLMGFVARRKQA